MADSVVSFVLQNLSQLLAREAKLLFGVEDGVISLHGELQMIDAILNSSDGKKNQKEIEQVVLSHIRDVAHRAEDVIDTFVANMGTHKRRSKLGRMLHGVDHAKLLRDVAEKIDNIKATLSDIRDNKIKYNVFQLQESESKSTLEDVERMQLLNKRRKNVEEDDVVGFVHVSKVITEWLLEEDSRSNVVSIIGMGGLGKTTLARKIYNSYEVKKFFDCRAWVYVSNDCRVKELLLRLLKFLRTDPEYEYRSITKDEKQKGVEIPIDISSLTEDELKQMVRKCLNRKRYLLVLDDLWKTQDWDEVQGAFPGDSRGSKILITSRLKDVASHTSQDHTFNLQLLSDEESWELFSKRVFRGAECPSDLEPLGKQIVKSCRGLPLSIVVLAGLLANKEKSRREWSKVMGNVNWYLTQDETQVKDIVLKLSYDNLPRRLKTCFMYLGIFPEDCEIRVRPLLERWVAEGFIQQTGTRFPEDVAEDYLYELIDRSLVQAARVKSTSGVKTCRIHDLLRDLCISESKKEKVFEVRTDTNIMDRVKPRRLSINCSMSHYIFSSADDHSCVRSLLCFDPWYHFTNSEWKWLFKRFRLVRVLDLGSNQCLKIPSNMGVFLQLRYLRINSQHIRVVPDSICSLQNLQTLDVQGPRPTLSVSLPNGLWKLKQLRHVYTSGPIVFRGHHRWKSDDEVMWNLQAISCIALNIQTADLFKKRRFPKLRKLGLKISLDREGKSRELLPSLKQLSHLKELKVFLEWEDSYFADPLFPQRASVEWEKCCKPHELLQSLQNTLAHLNALKIVNASNLLTLAVTFPWCITTLTLTGISCISDDGMNAMGSLTKLQILRIGGTENFEAIELNCDEGGWFPQLQVLEMRDIKICSWKLADGAMPCLQSVLINRCIMLNGLPSELWSLNALRLVKVLAPTNAFALAPTNLEMKHGCELIIIAQDIFPRPRFYSNGRPQLGGLFG